MATTSDTAGTHDWHSSTYVDRWIADDVTDDEARRPHLRRLAGWLSPGARRILDVGSGYGMLAEAVLEARPDAVVVVHDFSDPMLDHARRRLERFGDRVVYASSDLRDPHWVDAVRDPGGVDAVRDPGGVDAVRDPGGVDAVRDPGGVDAVRDPGGVDAVRDPGGVDAVRDPGGVDAVDGPFDAVVSSIAIHNVRDVEVIRRIYGEIRRLVVPGGCFFTMDFVARPTGGVPQDPDRPTLYNQLRWLTDAGFDDVDCLLRDGRQALMAGYRRPD